MLIKIKLITMLILIAVGTTGCAPSYVSWERSLNMMVGQEFQRYVEAKNFFWSQVNRDRGIDKIDDDNSWKRYYFTWVRDCKYSVLVDNKGIVHSWRYETYNREDCYDF